MDSAVAVKLATCCVGNLLVVQQGSPGVFAGFAGFLQRLYARVGVISAQLQCVGITIRGPRYLVGNPANPETPS